MGKIVEIHEHACHTVIVMKITYMHQTILKNIPNLFLYIIIIYGFFCPLLNFVYDLPPIRRFVNTVISIPLSVVNADDIATIVEPN